MQLSHWKAKHEDQSSVPKAQMLSKPRPDRQQGRILKFSPASFLHDLHLMHAVSLTARSYNLFLVGRQWRE